MILTPYNSTYPPFWGKEMRQTPTGWEIGNPKLEVEIPQEFNFFGLWCGKDPMNAKAYFDVTTRKDWGK